MDKEDRIFIREVGSKAVRVLKTKNIRLWNAFKERCEENGEKPESILGRYLLNFAKSILDGDGEFAEELLGKTIKVSALARRESMLESLDEILAIKKKLESVESSNIDKLIEKMIEIEISKAATSPIDMLKGVPQPQQEDVLVLDENTLASLPPEQLEALEYIVRKVKEEKVKSMQKSVEEIEEIVGEEEEVNEEHEEVGEEREEEVEEEYRHSEHNEDSDGSSEGVEDTGEGDRQLSGGSEKDEDSRVSEA